MNLKAINSSSPFFSDRHLPDAIFITAIPLTLVLKLSDQGNTLKDSVESGNYVPGRSQISFTAITANSR